MILSSQRTCLNNRENDFFQTPSFENAERLKKRPNPLEYNSTVALYGESPHSSSLVVEESHGSYQKAIAFLDSTVTQNGRYTSHGVDCLSGQECIQESFVLSTVSPDVVAHEMFSQEFIPDSNSTQRSSLKRQMCCESTFSSLHESPVKRARLPEECKDSRCSSEIVEKPPNAFEKKPFQTNQEDPGASGSPASTHSLERINDSIHVSESVPFTEIYDPSVNYFSECWLVSLSNDVLSLQLKCLKGDNEKLKRYIRECYASSESGHLMADALCDTERISFFKEDLQDYDFFSSDSPKAMSPNESSKTPFHGPLKRSSKDKRKVEQEEEDSHAQATTDPTYFSLATEDTGLELSLPLITPSTLEPSVKLSEFSSMFNELKEGSATQQDTTTPFCYFNDCETDVTDKSLFESVSAYLTKDYDTNKTLLFTAPEATDCESLGKSCAKPRCSNDPCQSQGYVQEGIVKDGSLVESTALESSQTKELEELEKPSCHTFLQSEVEEESKDHKSNRIYSTVDSFSCGSNGTTDLPDVLGESQDILFKQYSYESSLLTDTTSHSYPLVNQFLSRTFLYSPDRMSSLIVKPCGSAQVEGVEKSNLFDNLLLKSVSDSLDDSINRIWLSNYEYFTNVSNNSQTLSFDSSYLLDSSDLSPRQQLWDQNGDPFFESNSLTLSNPLHHSSFFKSNPSSNAAYESCSTLYPIHSNSCREDHDPRCCFDDTVLASPLLDLLWNPVLLRDTDTGCSSTPSDIKLERIESLDENTTVASPFMEPSAPSCETKQRRVAPSCFRCPKTSSRGSVLIDPSLPVVSSSSSSSSSSSLESLLEGNQTNMPRMVPILTPPTTVNATRPFSDDCKVRELTNPKDITTRSGSAPDNVTAFPYLASGSPLKSYNSPPSAHVTPSLNSAPHPTTILQKGVCSPSVLGYHVSPVQSPFHGNCNSAPFSYASSLVVLSRPPEDDQNEVDLPTTQTAVDLQNKTPCLNQFFFPQNNLN